MKKNSPNDTNHTRAVDKIVTAFFSTLLQEMGFTFISINAVEEDMHVLKNLRAVGIAECQQNGVWPLSDIPDDIRLKVLHSGRSEIIKGPITRPEHKWYTKEATSDLVRVFSPLSVHDTVIGIVEAGFPQDVRKDLTPKELRLFENLIQQTAISIENMQLFEQLLQERHLLHTLMDNIPDSIYFKDTKSRFIRASRALAEKFGIPDAGELIGKTDFDLFTDEHAQQAFDDEQHILKTGLPEIDIIEKETWNDNRITWVSTTKMPLHDDNGRVIGTFGVSRDITSRKEMEDALKFRLEFEEHISSLSSKFININLQDFDGAVRDTLELIGTFTIADRSIILLLNDTGKMIKKQYEWYTGDSKPEKRRFATLAKNEWLQNTMTKGHDLVISSIDMLPDGIGTAKEVWKTTGVVSLVYVPLILTGRLGGVIGIESTREEKNWSEDTTALLKIIGEVIMNAFSRKRAEEKLQHANNVLEQRVAERTDDLKNANELLKAHIGQLNFLNSSVYALSPIITLDELFPAVLDVFLERFPSAEGAICLHTNEKENCTYTTSGLNNEYNKKNLMEAAACIIAEGHTEPVVIRNREDDTTLQHISLVGIDDLHFYIAIPLIIDNSCKALLQIFTTENNSVIFEVEKSLLTTLAAHAAICLSNAINYQQRAEKARIDGELDAARSIQKRFTPQHRPDIPGIDLKGVYYPAYKVGGDYLDYFKTERGDWVMVIADVCGKGIPAALLMTTMRSAFRIQAESESSARALLCAVNKFMVLNIDERSFVTALCLIIAHDGSHMTYARAGHPFLIKLENGEPPRNIPCGGIALGLMQDIEMFATITEEKKIPLKSGDRYLLYTDGLVEAANPESEAYGLGRLSALLSHDHDSDPEQLVELITSDVRKFTNGAPDHDDLTMLCFKVL